MKIKTITCHDVYNVGASLQAYALQKYLTSLGHEVEIIDYRPEYLQRHYRLNVVSNQKYDKPFIRELYIIAKLPKRIAALGKKKRKEFIDFKAEYYHITRRSYKSCDDLKNCDLKADAYIAGSDQIWNPIFENGRDPSFYLDFVNSGKKISYAASFSVEELPNEIKKFIQDKLSGFDAVSVREKTGEAILKELGINAVCVCDPVFLIDRQDWEKEFVRKELSAEYLFVYDFDNSSVNENLIKDLARKRELKIKSYFNTRYTDCYDESGPVGFIRNLANAKAVISNSFHATAFALIFHKDFYVIKRREPINSRMEDLLEIVGLKDRMIDKESDFDGVTDIDWDKVESRMSEFINHSKAFLSGAIGAENE